MSLTLPGVPGLGEGGSWEKELLTWRHEQLNTHQDTLKARSSQVYSAGTGELPFILEEENIPQAAATQQRTYRTPSSWRV